MNDNKIINMIIDYGLVKGLIEEEDVIYSANKLLSLFSLNYFTREKQEIKEISEILSLAICLGIKQGYSLDTLGKKDIFDTLVMDAIMPRPSEIEKKFKKAFMESPKKAMDFFYQLSKDSNYIRMDRINKNICFKASTKYGELDITINLSKPEKDLKDIAAASKAKNTGYPKCALCYENVGFKGDLVKAPRQNHRVIPITLGDDLYYMQYSPYVYYNEHMIVFSKVHRPMDVNKDTFTRLLDFVDKFPHYFLGSNAGLPIVGGSILSHDHFQGGCYDFAIFKAKSIDEITINGFEDVKTEYLSWPLDVIKLSSKSKEKIIKLSELFHLKWQDYNDEEHEIYSFSKKGQHNAITPIALKDKDNYVLYLALRNNRTDENHQEGIFHPDRSLHHIKKENIGLIEVMGLAVLPGRLNEEINPIKAYLSGTGKIDEIDCKHIAWAKTLQEKYNHIDIKDIDAIIKQEIGERFQKALECCAVMRFGSRRENMKRFISYVNEK